MILNFNLIRLIIFSSFILIFPFIQKQWFNLYLFNEDKYSFYSILYYCSGVIVPLFICFSSFLKFTYYKFDKNNNKFIKGKSLLIITLFTLIFLSFVLVNYFYINIDLFFNLVLNINLFSKINYLQNSYVIFIVCILMIFRNTRIFLKKLSMVNFIILSLIIWHTQVNNILISNEFKINNYINLVNTNFINIIFLFTIELLFYLWSYMSYKNNLSDWKVPIPLKIDVLNISNIAIFYFFIFLYYSLLE